MEGSCAVLHLLDRSSTRSFWLLGLCPVRLRCCSAISAGDYSPGESRILKRSPYDGCDIVRFPGVWSLLLLIVSLPYAALCQPSGNEPAAHPRTYAEELIAAAHEKHLSEHRLWPKLMHYHPRMILPGVESQVDDPTYFLAPDGKTDPEAELDATIRAFFDPPLVEQSGAEGLDGSWADGFGGTQHPQCRFRARYQWLVRELQIDPARLVPQPCPRFDTWSAGIDQNAVTLVFPAAYLNNPASMFGHTFVRFDAVGQDEHSRMLAYSANYAAATAERSGMVFAFRGIFGLYHGILSVAPYYKMLKKYSDVENRDIWEYELTFTPEERERLIAHLWELGSSYFDYYFFDENCSYHLLSLFEAARPELDLTAQFPFWVIPSDTVRVVAAEDALLGDIKFRPATATEIRARADEMSKPERDLSLALAKGEREIEDGELNALPEDRRVRVLELAHEYLRMRLSTGKGTQEVEGKRAFAILSARSKIPASLPPVTVATPAIRPDQGHKSGRVSAGGVIEDGRGSFELQVRPAYHDLLDPEGGYVRGAEIRFFDLTTRINGDGELQVERFTPIGIRSYGPRTDFFRPISWEVSAEMRRLWVARDDEHNEVPLGKLAFGWSFELDPGVIAYGLGAGEARYEAQYDDSFALGGGAIAGLIAGTADSFAFELRGSHLRFGIGEELYHREVSGEARYELDRDLTVRAGVARIGDDGEYTTEWKVSVQRFF